MDSSSAIKVPEMASRLVLQQPPDASAAMFQEWRNLLFLHWKIDPDLLQERLPDGLFVDTFGGDAWIGIVPFYMRSVRPRFLPAVPGISNFLELNVRTYVFDRNGVPGVWFFSLDADSRLACALGRSLFNLAYRDAAMSAREENGWVRYSARRHGRDGTARFHYRGTGESRLADPGSLEFFLVERYLLYSFNQNRNRLFTGRVHHSPYRFQDAEYGDYSDLPAQWDDISMPGGAPDHALFVDSVKVRIFGIESL